MTRRIQEFKDLRDNTKLEEHAATISRPRDWPDASQEERRRVQERLIGLLTHRQARSMPVTRYPGSGGRQ